MTNLQVVKALDKQVAASFKRSASAETEVKLREDIRALQNVFREAHSRNVFNKKVASFSEQFLRLVTPDMAIELRAIIARFGQRI